MHTPDSRALEPDDKAIALVAEQAVGRYAGQPGNLLPILHAVQDALGFIPDHCVPLLADALQLSRAEIHGVIRFYPYFRNRPAPGVFLEVCRAEACQAMGGEALAQHAKQRLGCDFGHSADNGSATLAPVYCLGLCAQSPAVMIDGQPHARMTPAKLDQLLHAKGA